MTCMYPLVSFWIFWASCDLKCQTNETVLFCFVCLFVFFFFMSLALIMNEWVRTYSTTSSAVWRTLDLVGTWSVFLVKKAGRWSPGRGV